MKHNLRSEARCVLCDRSPRRPPTPEHPSGKVVFAAEGKKSREEVLAMLFAHMQRDHPAEDFGTDACPCCGWAQGPMKKPEFLEHVRNCDWGKLHV